MKVCVIGGAGYIGSHAVYELIRAGHEVVVIDNLSTGEHDFIPEKAVFYFGDITDAKIMDEIFTQEQQKGPIDVVMHFAAKLIVPESVSHPLAYYYNNVEGVRIMLETMVNHQVKNIVFSSTAAVYGDPSKEICEEDDIKLPINPYGETKLAAERLIQWVSKAHHLNYCIFRYFNVAGADETLEIGLKKDMLTHIVPLTVQTALGIRDSLTVYGNDYATPDGTCVRDYIHVTDLAKAHVLGAEYTVNENKSNIFNLGSNSGYSVLEVIKAIEKYYPVNYTFGPRRPGDPAKLIASNKRAEEILHWHPSLTLDDIVQSDIAYRKKNGK